ncbi:MAG: ABC transporter substrate-binding protein [Deltaproteobacteria bacterium]|jgi:NitT/TauT family transport system substrate-binding protein|nr:ABC transporter substrate-binding protein [Deltaproteobacteria bacterium]
MKTLTRPTLAAIFLALAIPALAIPLSPGPALAQAKAEPLKLGRNQGGTQTLPILAINEKFFQKEGLDVELVMFLGTSDGINALNVGKIDVGLSFGTGSPLTFAAEGAPIVIIAGNLAGGHPIITKPENAAKYKSVQDFKGKTVGTPRLYTADVVFRGAVHRAGLIPGKDFELIEFRRTIDVLEAVKSGKVDVGVGSSSITAGAIEAGLAIPLWSNDLFAYHPCCRIITTREVLAKRRPDLVKLIVGLLQAEREFVKDPEAGVKANMADLKIDETLSRTLTLDPHIQLAVDPNSKGVVTMWNYMKESKYITSDADPRSFIDASLYKEALDDLRKREPNEPYWAQLEKRFQEWN